MSRFAALAQALRPAEDDAAEAKVTLRQDRGVVHVTVPAKDASKLYIIEIMKWK